MTLADYSIVGKPDMTAADFARVLTRANSPASVEWDSIYAALVAGGIRPSVWLAFGTVESKLGTVGIVATHHTKNMGNVRSLGVPGAGEVVMTSRGPFASYASWAKGAADWAARLRGPKYAGAGLATVREVLPKYAPGGDSNDPDAYARTVLALIEQWTKGAPPMAQLTDHVLMMPPTNLNWWRETMPGGPRWITIHEVGNLKPGANAEATARYVLNGGGRDIERGGQNEGVSYHATVDEFGSWQMLPWDARGYHAGDGRGDGGMWSIGIETVQIGNFPETIRRLVILVKRLQAAFHIDADHVVQHNHWSGKNCPEYLRAGKLPITGKPGPTWAGFKAALAVVPPAPPPFQHAPGFLDPLIDRFDWTQGIPDAAGIVTHRTIRAYNDETGASYLLEWDASTGFAPVQEVK
jgi:hypothetical protein